MLLSFPRYNVSCNVFDGKSFRLLQEYDEFLRVDALRLV